MFFLFFFEAKNPLVACLDIDTIDMTIITLARRFAFSSILLPLSLSLSLLSLCVGGWSSLCTFFCIAFFFLCSFWEVLVVRFLSLSLLLNRFVGAEGSDFSPFLSCFPVRLSPSASSAAAAAASSSLLFQICIFTYHLHGTREQS